MQFVAPATAAMLLVGIACADRLQIDPHEADGYHAKAAAIIGSLPKQLGRWVCTQDYPLPNEVSTLLRPNAYVCRQYVEQGTRKRSALIMIVQCRDSRTMLGHYPPICYPAHGCMIPQAQRQRWVAGPITVDGTEYQVVYPTHEQRWVRNFFILPAGPVLADMEDVGKAAKNYQELTFGVTQVQVLFSGTVSREERDEAVAALIGANADLLAALRSKEPQLASVGVKS